MRRVSEPLGQSPRETDRGLDTHKLLLLIFARFRFAQSGNLFLLGELVVIVLVVSRVGGETMERVHVRCAAAQPFAADKERRAPGRAVLAEERDEEGRRGLEGRHDEDGDLQDGREGQEREGKGRQVQNRQGRPRDKDECLVQQLP